jgi:hypothetical protein
LSVSVAGLFAQITEEEAQDAIDRLAAAEEELAEVDLDFSYDASATLTWGFDLNSDADGRYDHGFTASGSASADLTFVDGRTYEKGADEGVYGWIELDGITFNADETGYFADGGDITARIMFAATTWLQIYSDGSSAFDYASVVDTDPNIDGTAEQTTVAGPTYSSAATPGVTFHTEFDPVTLEIFFVSATAEGYVMSDGWDIDYLTGLSLGVDVDPLTIDVYAGTGFGSNMPLTATFPLNFGVKVGLDVAMGGGLGIENTLGADFMYDSNYFYIEVSDSFDFGLTEDADGDIATKLYFDLSFAPDIVDTNVLITEMGNFDAKIGFMESTSDGFVDNLTFAAWFLLRDLLASTTATPANSYDIGMAFGASGSFKVVVDSEFDEEGTETVNAYITPGFVFEYEMGQNNAALTDEVVELQVYVKAGLIPNTTFTLTFDTDQLMDAKDVAQDKGLITFETKIDM